MSVVDSGYESEENYNFVDGSEQLSLFVKPSDHEQKKISTDEGILLRINRSIQAKGVFAIIEEDMNFRRFLTRGSANVMVEWYLVSMAFNILKLHHKIQTGRLGNHLFVPGAA